MALGKEAEIKVASEMIQGIWVASIAGASILSVISWLLADSTIQTD